jgi:hypothetical protein
VEDNQLEGKLQTHDEAMDFVKNEFPI